MSELQQILLPSVGDHGACHGEGTELQVSLAAATMVDKVIPATPTNL